MSKKRTIDENWMSYDAMLEKKKAEQAKKEKDADKELERQLREVINGEKHS